MSASVRQSPKDCKHIVTAFACSLAPGEATTTGPDCWAAAEEPHHGREPNEEVRESLRFTVLIGCVPAQISGKERADRLEISMKSCKFERVDRAGISGPGPQSKV
jgi:hypothetical protein